MTSQQTINFKMNDHKSPATWTNYIGQFIDQLGEGKVGQSYEEKKDGKETTKSETPEQTRLYKILNLQAESSAYSDAGKDDEAYGLLQKQYKLGPSVSFVPVLINYYKTLLRTEREDESEEVLGRLVVLVRDKVKATAKDCELLADQYRNEKDFCKSILFYLISDQLLSDSSKGADILLGLQGCVLGLKLCSKKLLKQRPNSRVFIRDRILPAMRKMRMRVQGVKGMDKRGVCLTVAVCLHHIEITENKIGELEARETSLSESLKVMREMLGDQVTKYHLYGTALNNLGALYLDLDRLDEAKEVLVLAIEVNMGATDYDTEAERQSDVKRSNSVLSQVEEKLAARSS